MATKGRQDQTVFTRVRLNEAGRRSLDDLRARVRGRNAVYLDYPLHYNIGDLLIMLGAMKMLRKEGVQVKVHSTYHSSSPAKLARILGKDDLIIFHGGGNFGDIYPAFHSDRLEIVERFARNEILFFPQTVDFQDHAVLERTRAILSKARRLTLLVRDRQSLAVAEQICDNVSLCADTAHYLGVPHHHAENDSVLLFRRRDPEAATGETGFDWSEIVSGADRRVWLGLKVLARAARITPGTTLDRFIFDQWMGRSETLFERACEKFRQYEFLDADRLHAVILATLLQMKMRNKDTMYGKIGRYREAWLEAE
ncbi:MAG TPA: polysaccharide pyruvyl transferase family protein [Novosphingobium sp.]|nr:polysaccharide pyruvyl transferase family protein [Novosphingobium sp.]